MAVNERLQHTLYSISYMVNDILRAELNIWESAVIGCMRHNTVLCSLWSADADRCVN